MARARKPPCEECGRPLTRREGQQACFCARKRKEARERAGLAEQRVESIVRAVEARDPDVMAAQVRALVEEVAPKTTMLAAIADHLESHPSALTDGGSRMPKVMAEFIYRAIEYGVTGLTSPSCALCGRPRTLFHTYEDGQRICTSCYSRGRRGTCSVCGREDLSIVKHAEDGGGGLWQVQLQRRPRSRVRRVWPGDGHAPGLGRSVLLPRLRWSPSPIASMQQLWPHRSRELA